MQKRKKVKVKKEKKERTLPSIDVEEQKFLRKVLKEWKRHLIQIVEKEATLARHNVTNQLLQILPPTLVSMAWNANIKQLVVDSMQEHGIGNLETVKEGALKILAEDVDRVLQAYADVQPPPDGNNMAKDPVALSEGEQQALQEEEKEGNGTKASAASDHSVGAP